MGNVESRKPPDPYQFYWSGKRRLYPDWEAVGRIDQFVAKTPAGLRGKPSKLVPYLISECRNDAEKFRAIFRWVTDNIKYDVNALNRGLARRYSANRTLAPNSVENVLSTSVAVCAGYVNVLTDLCERAGIEVTYIGGMAKNDSFAPGDVIDLERDQGHAWVSVKLGEKSYVCDPTWSAGYTDGTEGSKRFVRRFDETWFITDPHQFVETHWPRGVGSVGTREDALPELQFVEKPMTDFEVWCSLPIRKGSAGRFPLLVIPLSHKDGVVEAVNNMTAISFQYDKCPLSVQANVTALDSKRELEGFAKVEHLGKTYRVLVRLPVTTNAGYTLTIYAKPFYTDVDEVLTNVLCYKLQAKGDACHSAFPGDTSLPFLGQSKNFHDCKLETKTPSVLTSKDGVAKLFYTLPKSNTKRRNLMGKLVYRNENTNLKDEFCFGSIGRQLQVELKLKRQGDYMFGILVQAMEDVETYYYISSHVIVCEKENTELDRFPGRERPYGTTAYFHAEAYSLHKPKAHLIHAQSGCCAIEMTIPQAKDVAYCLQRNGKKYESSEECIYSEWLSGKVRFNIRLPDTGYFTFVMNELKDGKAGEWLACFLIHCGAAYGGNTYPKLSTIWGPSREFLASGCRIGQTTSTLRTKHGFARLVLKNTYQLSQLSFKLTDVKNRDCNTGVLAESKADTIIFYFRFQEMGNYRFSLHLLSERGGWKACLLNILVRVENQWSGVLFPTKPRLVGEHAQLRDLSLVVKSPTSALVRTTTGRCQVVLSGKLPVKLYHILKLGDEDMSQHVYCETDGNPGQLMLTYHFELPRSGMYHFLVYTDSQTAHDVYSAVIECTSDGNLLPYFTAKPVPNYQLGMDLANKADIELTQARSSTLRLVNGVAKLVLKIGSPNVEKLMVWYHCTKNEDRRMLGHHVLVERTGPRAEVTIAPPEPQRYLLVLAAKMKDQEELVKVGTFLIEPGAKVPRFNGFPVRFQPFYTTEGCRLRSPYRTTLERERTYDVEIFIPGADRIVVGGTVLNSKTRSHAHKGQVKVKAADKTVLVSAVFKLRTQEDVVHYLRFEVANKSKEQFITA